MFKILGETFSAMRSSKRRLTALVIIVQPGAEYGFSAVTGCTWAACIQRHQRTNSTPSGCKRNYTLKKRQQQHDDKQQEHNNNNYNNGNNTWTITNKKPIYRSWSYTPLLVRVALLISKCEILCLSSSVRRQAVFASCKTLKNIARGGGGGERGENKQLELT